MWIQFVFPLLVVAAAGLLVRAIVIGREAVSAEFHTVRERIALRAAFALALIPSAVLLVVPVYAALTESETTSSGSPASSMSRGTLIQANGLWVLAVLFLPVVLTAAGLAARASTQRRSVIRAGALLLTAFVVLAGFSVGLLYLPSAVALWVAAIGPGRSGSHA